VPRLTAVVAPAGSMPAGAASTLSFFAASSSPGFGGAPAAIAPPRAIGDGKPETAWLEGDELDGRGEFVMAHVETGRPIRALRIVPGDASSIKGWKAHNRLEKALLRVAGAGTGPGRRWLITFPKLDKPGEVRVELPEPLETSCLALVIVSVYPGSSPKLTAIGEVTALTDLDYVAGAARVKLLAADVAAGPPARALAAARALIDVAGGPDGAAGAAALEALAAALGTGRAPAAAVVAAIGLAEHPSRALGDMVVAALATPDAALRASLVETIAHHGEAMRASVVAPLAAGAPPSPAPRAALIEVLGRTAARGSAGAVDALLDVLGRCDAGDRAPLEKALGAAGAAAHAPLLAFADTHGPTLACAETLAKLLGGLGRPPAGTAADRVERVVALLAAWMAPERSFALRFHAARALGRFGGATAVKTLALAALKDPEERVRERAVRSLAEHEGEERPAAVIARALADPDPNVRLAALSEAPEATAGFADARKEAVAAAIAIVEGDPWPELRRGALVALVRFGGDEATAALLRACGDAQVEVAAAAMDAVGHTAPPGAAATLEAILVNEKLGARRRVAAAVALGDLGGHAGAAAPAVVKTLQRYRMLARGDEKAEELAQACARALGMIGAASPATAKEAKLAEELTDALVGGPTDPVRTACAWALGALGDAAACEILLDAKDNAPDPETRKEAARAAAKLSCGKK
jgi:HEAT repeat protein